MGHYAKDEVVGFEVGDNFYCMDHVPASDEIEDNLLTKADVEEGQDIIFCDVCGARIY